MYDHIGLKVNDIDTSVRFYEAALKTAGPRHFIARRVECGLRAERRAGHCGSPAEKGSVKRGAHIAIRASDHAAVDRFHKEGLKAGGRDNGPPGLRKDYSPTYYAAFLFDPDGNNVEAVCTK
jgi:catechol 2,3-dioxygenase-like lactoylglutathione lyase family enzyme